MKFDIEVSDLMKGDVIEQAECERIIGLKRDDNQADYQFNLMQLVDHIAKQLARTGKLYTIISEGGLIRILTDAEAAAYNANRFELNIRSMRRCTKRLTAVDAAKLSPEEKATLDKNIVRQSRILQMIGQRRATPTLEPVKRIAVTR